QQANHKWTPVAGDLEDDLLANLFVLTRYQEVLEVSDRLPINAGNHIAAAHAMALRLTACFNRCYQDTIRTGQVKETCQCRIKALHMHAKRFSRERRRYGFL